MKPILQLSAVSKVIGSNLIIKDISLTINRGEIVALIGQSGSGKTTILQIAGLLDKPTSGKVIINNEDCSRLSDNKKTSIRRNFLGFVYQFHYLLQEFSVIENVALPQLLIGRSKIDAHNSALAVLDKLGIASKAQLQISQISGGERQRVAIARGIVNAPALLLADEPTGNLDPKNSLEVLLLLQEYVKKHGVSVFLITHDYELAKKADRILHLQDGLLYPFCN